MSYVYLNTIRYQAVSPLMTASIHASKHSCMHLLGGICTYLHICFNQQGHQNADQQQILLRHRTSGIDAMRS